MHVCMYVCIYVCVYVHVCAYVCMCYEEIVISYCLYFTAGKREHSLDKRLKGTQTSQRSYALLE